MSLLYLPLFALFIYHYLPPIPYLPLLVAKLCYKHSAASRAGIVANDVIVQAPHYLCLITLIATYVATLNHISLKNRNTNNSLKTKNSLSHLINCNNPNSS